MWMLRVQLVVLLWFPRLRVGRKADAVAQAPLTGSAMAEHALLPRDAQANHRTAARAKQPDAHSGLLSTTFRAVGGQSGVWRMSVGDHFVQSLVDTRGFKRGNSAHGAHRNAVLQDR